MTTGFLDFNTFESGLEIMKCMIIFSSGFIVFLKIDLPFTKFKHFTDVFVRYQYS